MKTGKQISVCLVCGTIFSLITFIIVWVGIRGEVRNWENTSISTQCTPVNYNTSKTTCGTKYEVHDCYYGYMTVRINVNNIDYYEMFLVANDQTETDTLNEMYDKYPPQESFECWYNPEDPSDIRIKRSSDQGFIIAIIVLTVFIFMTSCLTATIIGKH